MRIRQAIGVVAAVVAATGLLVVASSPVIAGGTAQAGVASKPFEPVSPALRFNTLSYSWPGNPAVLRYDNKIKKLRDPVRKAASIWNDSGIDIKFKATTASKADIKIVAENGWPCGVARATTNDNSFEVSSALVELGTGSNPKRCVYTDVITTAHEFGHVLGLAHENDKCAVMNSSSTSTSGSGTNPDPDWPTKCTPRPTRGTAECSRKTTSKGAKSIYGGTPTVRDPEFCPVSGGLR